MDLYGGHVYDERDQTGDVVREGVMDICPDVEAMRKDFFSIPVSNPDHYKAIQEVYDRFGIIIEPHGAVGWRALDTYLGGNHEQLAVIYETADPGKFPDDVRQAIGVNPPVPGGIAEQSKRSERIHRIDEPPNKKEGGSMTLSAAQYEQTKAMIRRIFSS